MADGGAGSLTMTGIEISESEVLGTEPAHGILDEWLGQDIGTPDTVVLADVWEHLAEPMRCCCSHLRALRPDDRVSASVPNVAHRIVRQDFCFGMFQLPIKRNIGRYLPCARRRK
jgi:hypothetical protein